MTIRSILPVLALSALMAGCTTYGSDGPGYADGRGGGRDYDASSHYRDDPNYQERQMRADENVYRGGDGRYYCQLSDGTSGLIVGALAGGVLGDAIAPRGSKTLGTLLGGLGGAVAGQAIDQNNVRCR